jgi:hypothetical protein
MRSVKLVLAITLVALLAGCVMVAPEPQSSPVATSTPAPAVAATSSSAALVPAIPTTQSTVVAGPTNATLLGKVFSKEGNELKPLPGTVMWLAEVHWNADKTDGAFVLNGAASPSATIKDDSSFVFAAVPPGDYAIIVGDPMGMNAIVMEPDGKAKVVTLEAGKVLDVGKLEVQMTSQKS